MAGASVPRELAHAVRVRIVSTAPAAARAVTARPSAPSDVRRPATGVPHPWTGDTSVHLRFVDHGGAGAEASVGGAVPLAPTGGGVTTASEAPVSPWEAFRPSRSNSAG